MLKCFCSICCQLCSNCSAKTAPSAPFFPSFLFHTLITVSWSTFKICTELEPFTPVYFHLVQNTILSRLDFSSSLLLTGLCFHLCFFPSPTPNFSSTKAREIPFTTCHDTPLLIAFQNLSIWLRIEAEILTTASEVLLVLYGCLANESECIYQHNPRSLKTKRQWNHSPPAFTSHRA